jgi:hypothetical protein
MVIIEENEDFLGSESTLHMNKPYSHTIENLQEMQWIQCPISKLNHIYNCLKFDLAEEIDTFYG